MERVYRQVYVNREKVIRDVTDYVVNSYKSRRLFSKLGYLSPNGYEQKWQKKNLPVSEKT